MIDVSGLKDAVRDMRYAQRMRGSNQVAALADALEQWITTYPEGKFDAGEINDSYVRAKEYRDATAPFSMQQEAPGLTLAERYRQIKGGN